MKIIVGGAGRFGSALVENLAGQPETEVTVIDDRPERLNSLRAYLDISTIQGEVNSLQSLEQAEVGNADIFIAMTASDSVNLMGCALAHHVFGSKSQLARVSDPSLSARRAQNPWIPKTTTLTNPTFELAQHIQNLIGYPSILQISNFASGMLTLFSFRVGDDTPLLNRPISYLYDILLHTTPDSETLDRSECIILAIFREGEFMKPRPWTLLEAGDEAFVITKTARFDALIQLIKPRQKQYKNIFIYGAGEIGVALARLIESRYRVKVLDPRLERCQALNAVSHNTLVLQGEGTDTKLLQEEGIESMDLFCALSSNDETNFVSSLYARSLGAKHVLALLQNPQYQELVSRYQLPIDNPLSPRVISLSSVLSYINKDSSILRILSLRGGLSEAVEAKLGPSSPVSGRAVSDIQLPHDCTIGAVVRDTGHGRVVKIVDDDFVIYPEDRLIFFLPNFQHLSEVMGYLNEGN